MIDVIRLAYITAKNTEEAKNIGKVLVEEHLAACVNILPATQSLYFWKGSLEESNEAVLLAKTVQEHVPALIARCKELSSYDCPCILILPVEEGSETYMDWVDEECRSDSGK